MPTRWRPFDLGLRIEFNYPFDGPRIRAMPDSPDLAPGSDLDV